MDLESESRAAAVVVGEDVNERNGIQLADSDQHEETCIGDPAVVEIQSSITKKKGQGLKTWRRIRREDVVVTKKPETGKDYDSDSTTGRMLKRGSANVLNENDNGNGNGNSSISPLPKNHSTFNVGADSDVSEDSHTHSHRSSSKSSTAASHPKLPLRGVNKNPIPSVDPIKKPKKTSPLSSMESDSRSSNPFSVLGSQQQQQQQQHQQQPPPAFSSGSSDQYADPLVHSISLLQSAQRALQTEIQKFEEIGKGIYSLFDDCDKTSGISVPSVSVDPLGAMDNDSDGWSEFNHPYLSKIVQTLERQLNVAKGSLEEKELRIAELKTTTRSTESPEELARSTVEQQYKIEMDAELQDLMQEKLEDEVKLIVIARYSKDLSVLVEDQIKFSREQSSLSQEQAESPRMTVNAENKAVMLKGQAKKSDALYGGILDGEEIQMIQRRVFKFTKCVIIQLILLVLVFAVFFLPLVPKSVVVVPT